MTSNTKSFEEIESELIAFIRARKFDQRQSPKGLAISLSLEANELLEYYQWREDPIGTKADLESELADILIYAIQFANKLDIDIPTIIKDKMTKMEKKYPVEIFQIEDDAERARVWLEAKQNYKKDTTL